MSNLYYCPSSYGQRKPIRSFETSSVQPIMASPYTSGSPASSTSAGSPEPYFNQSPPKSAAQYLCLHQNCVGVGFSRYADLQRHVAVIHNQDSLTRFDCELPNCPRRGQKGFTRRDKMVEHMREVHKLPIPKRVAGRRGS